MYVRFFDGTLIFLLIYVDDILLTGNCKRQIDLAKKKLSDEFQMKDLGKLKNFMNLSIQIDQETGTMKICQAKYASKILQKFGMATCNPVSTPIEPKLKLLKQEEAEPIDKPYKQIIGSLMYLMIGSRPDLCFALNYLSRFQEKPSIEHWNCLKRLLRYVKGTTDYALVYQRSDAPAVVGYCDADWASDVVDRKSTSGFLSQVFGNTISWTSRKQGLVTTSSTEAEYVSATEAAKEALWIIKLLTDMQIKVNRPVKIFEDNVACIFPSENQETKRLKHLDVKYYFLCDLVEQRTIKLIQISTKMQLADVLTKGLDKQSHNRLIESIGMKREGVLTT